jgi:flagellar hook protein FlgE|tara:strand:- start:13204 stop:14490 length:1287 start_codon:yes stop_codon:yes gene_type:complete
MSLYVALTGLKGAQTALGVTSNNIANANSVGFKRSQTEFADIVASSGISGSTRGAGTVLKATEQQFQQGIIETTGNTFDLAVSGEGFFAVRPSLEGTDVAYTRAGAFNLNKDGYVVGSSGQHLLGYPVGPDGAATSKAPSLLQPIQLPQTSGEPVASSVLGLSVNLPKDGEVIPDGPRYIGTPYAFDPADPLSYNHSTPATLYDDSGTAQAARVFYTRTSAPTAGDPNSSWTVNITIDGEEVAAADGNPITMTFDEDGALAAPAGPFSLAAFDPGNGASPINLTFDPGTATSQKDSPFTVYNVEQDGVPPGRLNGVSIDESGLITAGFSNGQSRNVGRVAIANFSNPQELLQSGQSTYQATGGSGDPQFLEAGQDGAGNILSGSIERANVDLTEELVQLITAQRNFQANAKTIETDNSMTQSILQIRT